MAKNRRQTSQDDADLARKSYRTILKQEIVAGLAELKRPVSGLFLSSLSAGLDVGFSLLLMAALLTLTKPTFDPAVIHILMANMYSVGFILVILGRSELFTEHTTLAVLPLFDRKATLGEVGRVWGVVFAGNIVGAAFFASLTWTTGPALGVVEPWALVEIAEKLTRHAWWVVLLSGILAGWLMGELAWLIAAGRDTISQVFFVWLVTTAIGLLGLHHSIAGTVEVLAGVFAGPELTMADFARFLVFATLGNAIGGVVFVAVIKYGHAIHAPDRE